MFKDEDRSISSALIGVEGEHGKRVSLWTTGFGAWKSDSSPSRLQCT